MGFLFVCFCFVCVFFKLFSPRHSEDTFDRWQGASSCMKIVQPSRAHAISRGGSMEPQGPDPFPLNFASYIFIIY